MAQKRMFDKSVAGSDLFLEMPLSTQALYFHLNLGADDDGFVNNPKTVMRIIGTNEDDLKILVAKSFVIPFKSGVLVIAHWNINNYIRTDRYKKTLNQEEKAQLVDNNGVYEIGIPTVDQLATQTRLDKNRLGEVSVDKTSIDSPKNCSNIFTIYEQEISSLSPSVVEDLELWIEELGEELVLLAIKTASQSNKKSFNYIKGILNNWKSEGLKTVSDVENKKKEFSKNKTPKKPADAKKKSKYKNEDIYLN